MDSFAQNYPQIMNQAVASGYTESELANLRQAFEVALEMADGFYRAQGVPLLNHLTSTASILLRENRTPELVIVGLLHAAFVLQYFDDASKSRNLKRRRSELAAELGQSVADLLWDYERLPWYRKSVLEDYLVRADELDERTRGLLAVRLANELDDQLDHAVSYSALDDTGMRSLENLALCRDLADKLGLQVIARNLEVVLSNQVQQARPVRWNRKQGYRLTTRRWEMPASEKLKTRFRNLAKRLYRRTIGRPSRKR